jgi:hypothetical protein
MIWKHDDLARDLAAHLRRAQDRMVWIDMQLGPSGSMRPDVFTMAKSYSRPAPHAYECKISVADFRGDITSGKYLKYYENASLVTFAVPQGLITKADIPKGCGLIVRGDEGWRTIKGATSHPFRMTNDALMKLLIDGVQRLSKPAITQRDSSEWRIQEKIRKDIGKEVADFLTDSASVRRKLNVLKTQHNDLLKKNKDLEDQEDDIKERFKREAIQSLDADLAFCSHPYNQIRQALGIADSDKWRVREQLQKIANLATEDERMRAAAEALRGARSQIDRCLLNLGAKE